MTFQSSSTCISVTSSRVFTNHNTTDRQRALNEPCRKLVAQTLTASNGWRQRMFLEGQPASRTIDNYHSASSARHCAVCSPPKPPQALQTTHATHKGIPTTHANRSVQPTTHLNRPLRPAPRYRQHAHHSEGVRGSLPQAGRRP